MSQDTKLDASLKSPVVEFSAGLLVDTKTSLIHMYITQNVQMTLPCIIPIFNSTSWHKHGAQAQLSNPAKPLTVACALDH